MDINLIKEFLKEVKQGKLPSDKTDLSAIVRLQEKANYLLNKPARVSWRSHPSPEVVKDENYDGREWVSRIPFQYYLYQDKDDGLWSVIDRSMDLAIVGGCQNKQDAIDSFLNTRGTFIE